MEQKTTAEPSGILHIDKPAGLTSHDVVGRIRRLYHTRRVGHTGTLDPMATGVLTVLVGRAAKAAEYLVADSKTYEAELLLGLTTDTEDTTGKTLTTSDAVPSTEQVLATAAEFVGDYAQIPPMVSALKVGGRKLVDLARKGVEIERKPRHVTIFSLICTPTDDPLRYRLCVHCSSGTYIRTLCADIGARLGCGGVMAALRRIEAGGTRVEDCRTPDAIEALDDNARVALLKPVEELFLTLPSLPLPAFFERLARSGCEIYQKKLGTDHPLGARLRLQSADGHFWGLGEVREYPDGSAVKVIKLFELSVD